MTTTYTPTGSGWGVEAAEHELIYLRPEETVKDLGLHRLMLLSAGEHFSKVRTKIGVKVAILCRRRLTPPAMRYMADTVVKSSLMYGMKFLAVTQAAVDAVEKPLKGAFKTAAMIVKGLPDGVLNGPRGLGGMRADWGISTRARQIEMLMGELHDPVMSMYAEGAIQRLTESTGVADGIYDFSTELRLETAKTTWLGALACWGLVR